MSFKLQQACFYLPFYKCANEKFVLAALADFADDNGNKARPSIARLMYMTSLSRSSVQRALDRLRKDGIIKLASQARLYGMRPEQESPAGGKGKTAEYRIDADFVYELAEKAKSIRPWNETKGAASLYDP